jgi:hypothetical protein
LVRGGPSAAFDEVLGDLSASCSRLEEVATNLSARPPKLVIDPVGFGLLLMLREAVEGLGAGARRVRIHADPAARGHADRGLVLRAVQRILGRAVAACESHEVTIEGTAKADGWTISIHGPPGDWAQALPPFCAIAVDAQGGSIDVTISPRPRVMLRF